MATSIGRRQFISALGGASLAWPLAVRAQQPAMPVIGFLSLRSPNESVGTLTALRQGLSETGFVEGQNLVIEPRFTESHYDRLLTLATELMKRPLAVFIAGSQEVALVAKAATTTIPIVFISGRDPVELGLVASLARPGGNLTGVNLLVSELWGKQLELLHELVPSAVTIGLLVNPNNKTTEVGIRETQKAVEVLGLKLVVVSASTEGEFEAAFASLEQQRIKALFVPSDPVLNGKVDQLVAIAARHSWPAVYALREFAAAGGLMSYGSNLTDAWRQIGVYAGRILKGAKPADLPIIQPTKFELVINLKTAKALGLTITNSMQLLANEVIE
jgi:putative ABC transport system substrate-binding protein